MIRSINGSPKPSPAKTIAKWAFVFLFSIWMFILGVMVGRGTIPFESDIKDPKKELIQLKRQVTELPNLPEQQLSGNPTDLKADVEFYKELKKTDDEIAFEPIQQENQSTVGEPKKPLSEKPGIADSRKQDRQTGGQPPKKASKKTETMRLSEGKKGTLTIQAASFRKLEAANACVGKLRKIGMDAYLSGAEVSGKGVWHRVRIGTYQTKADASEAMAVLKKHGYSPIVVKKE